MAQLKLWRKPLDADDFQAPRGEVHVIPERCKGCNFCIEFCPRDVLAESKEFNSKGYHPPEIVDIDSCVFCQLCELICPEFAIYVLEVTKDGGHGEEDGEEPSSEKTSEDDEKSKEAKQ